MMKCHPGWDPATETGHSVRIVKSEWKYKNIQNYKKGYLKDRIGILGLSNMCMKTWKWLGTGRCKDGFWVGKLQNVLGRELSVAKTTTTKKKHISDPIFYIHYSLFSSDHNRANITQQMSLEPRRSVFLKGPEPINGTQELELRFIGL